MTPADFLTALEQELQLHGSGFQLEGEVSTP